MEGADLTHSGHAGRRPPWREEARKEERGSEWREHGIADSSLGRRRGPPPPLSGEQRRRPRACSVEVVFRPPVVFAPESPVRRRGGLLSPRLHAVYLSLSFSALQSEADVPGMGWLHGMFRQNIFLKIWSVTSAKLRFGLASVPCPPTLT